MRRGIPMVVFIGIVLFSLITGNCLSCPILESAQQDAHSCCPNSHKQKAPAEKKDCPSELFFSQGFSKADAAKTIQVEMAPATTTVVSQDALLPVAPVFAPEAKPHSPPDLYLLHSVLLV